jgi:hypothetical protein
MYKFRKQYENDSIAFNGRLITKRNLTDAIAEQLLKLPSLAHRIEKVEAVQEIEIVAEKPKKSRVKKAK